MSGAATRNGWVPKQHGAWAMLIVPYLLGVVMAVRAGVAGPWLLPLFAFWMLGYFAFNAASLWLKSAARRRPAVVPALGTYAAASALMGVATLALGGWGMTWWVLAYLPLVLPALWLAAQRNERATLGGALTVAAASLMALVARFPDPRSLLDAGAAATAPVLVAVLVFAYFFGTVLYVKTNIRERNNPAYLRVSIAWHAAWTLIAAALAAAGHLAWWWTLFFAATTARAWLVPGRGWTAKRIGIIEGVFCLVLGACFLLW